jgi:DNA (cytosine-5)-methyltransferase 1
MAAHLFTFIDLFAGIGGMRLPFDELGGDCVFSAEIDESCRKVYSANFGEIPFGDVTLVAPDDVPKHDILLGGFPCQAFSVIGRQLGFADTRGTLFFTVEQILRAKRPRAFLLENVKQLRTHDEGRTFRTIIHALERLGYTARHTVLNSLDFGVPQKRERVYIVGFLEESPFSFPKGEASYSLASVLEPDGAVDAKYFTSGRIRASRLAKFPELPERPTVWHENKSGNVSALPYSCALRASASYNYLLVNGERRFTEREMLRLQGFPENFEAPVGYAHVRKQTGNAVTVTVIRALAARMVAAL